MYQVVDRIFAAVLSCATAMSMTACNRGGQDPDRGARTRTELVIGVASFTLAAPYFIGMAKAVEDEAKAYGNVRIVSTDARGNAARLTSDIDDLVARGLDGVIISAGPLEAAPAALNTLKQKAIATVLVDRKLKGGDYTSWIGPDNAAIGRQDGEYIAGRLAGKGTLVVVRGGPADNSIGLDRTAGMLSVVRPHAGITVVTAPSFGEWSSDGGLKVMETMLAQHPRIDAVFCENDAMCLGAQKAIGDAGRSNEMFLAGVDGQKEALKAILDGTNFAVTGVNNSDQIGRAGFHRMMTVLAGGAAPKDTILPSPRVTRENAARYYDPASLF